MPATSKTREQRLDELIAKDEIHELLIRYSRGCDRADEEELRSVFHPDAYLDYGDYKGNPAEFAAWATKIHLEQFESTSHCMVNSLVVVDGDVATGETYVLTWMRMAQDGKLNDLQFWGRYVDHFEKRAGVWKIAKRTVVLDRDRLEANIVLSPSPVGDLTRGRRDRDDLSYGVVGLDRSR